MNEPSDGAITERALSLANEAVFTVALQCRRLRTTEPEDGDFVFRWWADLQFLIVALVRLRAAANAIRKAKGVKIDMAIKAFDNALPSLRKMRDVGEHIDDYASDSAKRHHKEVRRFELAVADWDGTTFSWLGASLNVDIALSAAEALFQAMQSVRNAHR